MAVEKVGQRAVHLPFIARPTGIITFVSVAVLVAAAAFVLGLFVRSPSSAISQSEDETITVFAPAEMRVVDEGLSFQALVVSGPRRTIAGDPVSEFGRAVVTGVSSVAGQTVGNRQLVAQVSGRPLIALALSVPLYRDLHYGDEGPDVASMQAALGLAQSGSYDGDLREAVVDLYEGLSLEVPGGSYWQSYIRMTEILDISPSQNPLVVQIAKVGAVLSSDAPLLVLETGPTQVTFRANAEEIEGLAIGQPVIVQGRDAEVPGSIVAIGAFQPPNEESASGGGTSIAGYDIVVEATDPAQSTAHPVGQAVVVRTSEKDEPPALAVPLLAIRQDAEGTFVLRETDEGKTSRVLVRLTHQANGWAAVTSEELEAGDRVQVRP